MNAGDAIPTKNFTEPSTLTGWLKQLSIAALYLLFGYVIHHYFTGNGIVSVIWPGSGLALAALLIGGRRYIWGVFLGALLINTLSNDSLIWVISATSANVLEALSGVWLLTRNNKFSSSLNTLSDYLELVVLGGGVAGIIPAVMSVSALSFIGVPLPDGYIHTVLHWWMGDTLGVVLVAPLILAWWPAKPGQLTGKQLIEGLLLVGITFIAGQFVFLDWFHGSINDSPEACLMYLYVTWVAIRLGTRGVTLVLLMIATQAILGATQEIGYFAHDMAKTQLHNYWFYTLSLSVVGVALASYVNEIKQKRLSLSDGDEAYHSILATTLDGFWVVSLQGKLLDVNNRYVHQSGYSREELLDMYITNLEALENADDTAAHIQRVIETGVDQFESMHRRKDGSVWHVEVSTTLCNSNGGKFFVFLRDISERKQSEANMRIAAIAFESQEGVMVTDADGVILKVNRAFTEITGYSALEIVGQTPRLLKSGRHKTAFYREMWESIQRTGSWQGEIWDKRKNGEIYPKWLTITAVNGDDGTITHYVGVHSDITERKAAEEEIKHLAFYDPLTGLPNRRLLRDRLKWALAASDRNRRKGALLFIDLDNFKTLNDTLGHDMGDLLLQQVAERLTSCVREGDTVARLGGDEFVAMLEGLSNQTNEAAAQTKVIGKKILAALNQPYLLATHDYHSTPSIGVTLFNDHEQSVDELLKQADTAMYQAKTSGRNALRFFDPKMQARINARIALEADLRLAVEENQFILYYQPQVFHNGRFIGAEVLIRWQHPQHGLVFPTDFIPLAEETGLILPIGQWVLETACAQIKIWESSEPAQHLQLAVNVSARQFHQADFVEQVREVLNRSMIKPDRLKLELTESLVLDDIKDAVLKINALQEIGVCFSMDDFGTGYSSLAYLTQLPLNQLKIDQSFVRNIGMKPSDSMILQTIIGMANNLGMEVIAEGVETEAQRAFLELHDCPACQGYLFSKPVPLAEFEQLLKLGD